MQAYNQQTFYPAPQFSSFAPTNMASAQGNIQLSAPSFTPMTTRAPMPAPKFSRASNFMNTQSQEINPFTGFTVGETPFQPQLSDQNQAEEPRQLPCELDSDLPTPEQYVKQGFHVTNLCKFFINGGCYNENCTYAHSRAEMDAHSAEHNPFWRTRKCRAFHNNKFCEYGSACLYKHELQGCKRKRRHFYITNLPTASYVYSEMSETEPTEETCLSGASRLPIFAQIHA